jgi:hypothetical protein
VFKRGLNQVVDMAYVVDGYVCGTNGVRPRPVAPLKRWTPTIAPDPPLVVSGSHQAHAGIDLHGRLQHRHPAPDQAESGRHGGDVDLCHLPRPIRDHRCLVRAGPGRWLYFATQTAIYRIVN